MMSQEWGPLINLLHKAKKDKQRSGVTEPERTEAELSNATREQ
jgi:hypothetical protein